MQQKELEGLIRELETRLERLRQLYDQYFLGFEKLEPTVARKDVDRRIETLRHEQIRNTALRFRFTVITQKYNTYSTFWIRTCRQIEEGTYKRHVRRAQQRFGATGPGRRAAADSGLDLDIDVDLGELEAEVERDLATMREEEEIARDTSPPSRGAIAAKSSAADDDDDDALDTLRPPPSAQEGAREIPRQAPPPQFAVDSPSSVQRRGVDPLRQDRPLRPAALPPAAGNRRVLLRRTGDQGRDLPRDLPPESARSSVRASPAAQPAPQEAPPSSRAPDTERPAQPVANSERKMPRVEKKSERKVANAPQSAAAASSRSKPAPALPSAHARGKNPDLSDERMRQLYSEYIQARRSRKESTAAITYDALAKSLRDSSERLSAQHRGKKVDFEVTEKDGKTILRPVVK